ncbi:hypothetical protein OCA16_25920 [Bacillus cereus]|nr:hypothetical protein [Bacillus cereus]
MSKKDIIRFPHSKADEIRIANGNLNAVIKRLQELGVSNESILARIKSL